MERKMRNRINENDAKLMLIKLLPMIFIVLLYLVASSIGLTVTTGGPVQPGCD